MSSRRLAVVALIDAVVVIALAPDLGELRAGAGDPRGWVVRTGADHALATLAGVALWLVALRVAIGLAALLLAHLPGTLGRVADAVAGRVLPAVVRRVLIGSAGLGVLLAPLAAHAQDVPTPAAPASVAASGPSVPGPAWPATGPSAAPSTPTPSPAVPLPGPAWPHATPGSTASHRAPTSSAPTSSAPTSSAPTPSAPTDAPTSGAPTRDRRPVPPASEPSRPAPPAAPTVEVRTGDCLWMIAAHRLGPSASAPEIAGYVPRLYAANADVIGTDPDVVRPGQVLALPPVSGPDRAAPSTRVQEAP